MAPGLLEQVSNGDGAVSLASVTANYHDTIIFYCESRPRRVACFFDYINVATADSRLQ
jgi:hypothetical protein